MNNPYNQNQQETPNNYAYNGRMSSNDGYINYNALQIRLNTEPVVRQIEMYLRGYTEYLEQDENGKLITSQKKIGEPLANESGIQAIMSLVEMMFNPQVVQGNFKEYTDYEDYLVRTRKDLADELIINLDDYNIKRERVSAIISKIMRFVEAYMTRLLDNKERDSYAATFKSVESSQTTPSNKRFKLPFV